MKTPFLALFSLLILSACATDTRSTDAARSSFTCSDGKTYLTNSYQDKNQAELLDLTLPDGKTVTLINVVAASGARYVGSTYEWWNKGKAATFSNQGVRLECSSAPL